MRATVKMSFCRGVLIFFHPRHSVLLGMESYIFIHDSVLHYLFLSVLWTLDLWFDVLLPNSQPISPILLNRYVADECSPWQIVGDKNQLKHLLGVHLTIHLYIEDEVMVSALGTLSLFQLQEKAPKDEVEIEFTSRDT